MTKAKKKAPTKRAEQYDPQLAINGSFSDVIGISMGKQQQEKKEEKKAKK